MDISSPSDIFLDQVTLELISDAKVLARQVNESRPLSQEVIRNIEKELLGERVYNSNAIEGNTLTLRETRSVLQAGGIVDVSRKREAAEALNLAKAIAEVQQMIQEPESWSDIHRFTAVHRTILSGVEDDAAGRIRSGGIVITGAKYQPPDPAQLDVLLSQFFTCLKDATQAEPILVASWAHWVIVRIHAFEDGNGRLARLWQDLILFGNKLTAAVIQPQDRTEYYAGLESADGGNLNPLTQLVARSLNRTLQIYINEQREVDELKDWAVEIVGETNARVDEKRKLEYLRWVRQMDQLRDAFERCATQVTNASNGAVEVQVKSFDIIDQTTWETLRSGGDASKTWYFWANFRNGNVRVRYCFFFGRHWFSEVDRDTRGMGPNTCLLVSEQRGDEKAVRLSEIPNCSLTLREILVVGDKLARRRFDIVAARDVHDLEIDSLLVAREFVQEVFLKRLT